MRTLVFTGNVDKRILVLPLLRGLSGLGETLLVTDDPNYLRGTDKNEIMGSIKVKLITHYDSNFVLKYDDGVDYINVVWDVREFIPKNYDKLIVCRHKDRTLCTDKILQITDEVDKNGDAVTKSDEVVITHFVDKKELKKAHYTDRGEHTDILGKAELLELKSTDYKWLSLCEETSNILAMKNAAVTGLVAKLTCESVGMPAKDWEAIINRA